ncbi:MAG: metallophosphoesterase family protein [Dehalococcoidales bacterium]|nr:MAG: metallophosphoesterase family protein [Dehalococcoidales bacterium]
MRYAIIADIHSNLAAFQAVIDDVKKQETIDKIWCLGDIVGYGPDPHECIELLRATEHICVAGNHDRAVIGQLEITSFNPHAAEAVEWTAGKLSIGDITYLKNLPESIEDDEFLLVHGSPREPIMEYILSMSVARQNFDFFRTRYCLVGHTHVPQAYSLDEEDNCTATRFLPTVKLITGETRLIINPGAVGQPRDGNPEASYAIYDNRTRIVRLRRVPYDIRQTQDRIMESGLPPRLAARLETGE